MEVYCFYRYFGSLLLGEMILQIRLNVTFVPVIVVFHCIGVLKFLNCQEISENIKVLGPK